MRGKKEEREGGRGKVLPHCGHYNSSCTSLKRMEKEKTAFYSFAAPEPPSTREGRGKGGKKGKGETTTTRSLGGGLNNCKKEEERGRGRRVASL